MMRFDSHENKEHFILGREVMTNLILHSSREHYFCQQASSKSFSSEVVSTMDIGVGFMKGAKCRIGYLPEL